jgi:hypothetical protein
MEQFHHNVSNILPLHAPKQLIGGFTILRLIAAVDL